MCVADEITLIESMDSKALRERWRLARNAEPPAHLSPQLLRSTLIYELQEQCFGGINRDLERRLKRIAARLELNPDAPVTEAGAPAPGTRLIREWRGERHIVEVLTSGFSYHGSVYGSLSEIAREITGARWSGPRFFGLKNRWKKP